mmetsp:Transcript_53320/g.126874  ORF Transcript_53320/g.126874 Transcript_53320/m.126874 type:complete len:218 (+) Transcript_53320:156-809(+)
MNQGSSRSLFLHPGVDVLLEAGHHDLLRHLFDHRVGPHVAAHRPDAREGLLLDHHLHAPLQISCEPRLLLPVRVAFLAGLFLGLLFLETLEGRLVRPKHQLHPLRRRNNLDGGGEAAAALAPLLRPRRLHPVPAGLDRDRADPLAPELGAVELRELVVPIHLGGLGPRDAADREGRVERERLLQHALHHRLSGGRCCDFRGHLIARLELDVVQVTIL